MEEQQPNKSTRTYRQWKAALKRLVKEGTKLDDKKIRTYYDQGLMPDVCFKALFNK